MPAFLSQMSTQYQLQSLAQLEVVQYGGEPIQNNWLQQALAHGIHLYQLFGLTEHSVYSNSHRMKIGEDRLIIGDSYKNYYTDIVDKDGQILRRCHTGELRTSGIGVARGYYGRIQNEKFGEEHHRGMEHQIMGGLKNFREGGGTSGLKVWGRVGGSDVQSDK
jgi:non-ribosomal peptide synthetase component F